MNQIFVIRKPTLPALTREAKAFAIEIEKTVVGNQRPSRNRRAEGKLRTAASTSTATEPLTR
jgi:hypothetical protein